MAGDMVAQWYFDIISPFAYLQINRFQELPAGLEIVPRPVLLGAILSHWKIVGPAEVPPKRLHTYRMCLWTARSRGLTFRMPPRHPFNPLPGLRLLSAVGPDVEMAREALAFVFAEGRAPDSDEEMAAFARHLGIAGDARAIASDQSAKDALRRNTEEAISRGVFGVPSFHLSGEVFWGDDATGLFADHVRDRKLLGQAEWRALDAIPVGIERKLA
jgi:2-hydroxychromene-2-carboxylate isomerase